MADISKITLPSGTTYDIKDAVAREAISAGFSLVKVNSFSNLPTASASTKGVIYLVPDTHSDDNDVFDEYVTVQDGSTYSWEKLGNTDVDLSGYSQTGHTHTVTSNVSVANHAYTPAGSVSQPTFTGTEGTVSVTGTPAGSVTITANKNATGTKNYTPEGSVTKPTFTGTEADITVTGTPSGSVTIGTGNGTANYTPAGTISVTPNIQVNTTTVNSITNVGTLPSLTTTVTDENLTISFSQGTLPTKGGNTTVATGIKSQSASGSFTGTGVQLTASFAGNTLNSSGTYTPAGDVSKPTFSGTATLISGSFSGNSLTSTGKFTPAGTVSKPTFSGTQATLEHNVTNNQVTSGQNSK